MKRHRPAEATAPVPPRFLACLVALLALATALPTPAQDSVNEAFEPLAWLIGDWQAEFRPMGGELPSPTMSFRWGDGNHSFIVMTGTQPTPEGLKPEYEGMIVWQPVLGQFVFLTAYRSDSGRLTESGEIDLLDGGAVRLNMHVHYAAGAGLPFSDGKLAGPEGHTLEFRRTFHQEPEDRLRGVFELLRDDRWKPPIADMGDGFLWRRMKPDDAD